VLRVTLRHLLLGAALGVGMGMVFGIALQQALADRGVDLLRAISTE
jgi:ABC-type nitrate/sulfonate/bicarbonate transport system permease component